MTAEQTREQIAEVLAGHAQHVGANGSGAWWAECLGCDWTEQQNHGGMAAGMDAHRAHVAAAIAAALPDPEQAVRCNCNASGGYLKGHGPDPANCPVHGDPCRDLRVKVARVRRALDDELANLADDGARLSHTVVRRIEAALDGAP